MPRILCLLFVGLSLVGQAQEMPDCSLTSLDGKEQQSLERLRQGKVIYVDFWASWCTTCVKSFPFLNALERDLKGKDFSVISINVDENREDAHAFLARTPAQFAVLADPGGQCAQAFGVQGMPKAYVIDRTGQVRHEYLGFRPGEAETIRQELESLLREEGGGSS